MTAQPNNTTPSDLNAQVAKKLGIDEALVAAAQRSNEQLQKVFAEAAWQKTVQKYILRPGIYMAIPSLIGLTILAATGHDLDRQQPGDPAWVKPVERITSISLGIGLLAVFGNTALAESVNRRKAEQKIAIQTTANNNFLEAYKAGKLQP